MATTAVEEEQNEVEDAADNDQAAVVDTAPEVTQCDLKRVGKESKAVGLDYRVLS